MGASTSIRMAGTPMSVYRRAEAEGDTEKMKRALGYAGECTEKAADYQEKLDEGIKAEAEDKREEKEKLEKEAEAERLQAGRKETEDAVSISDGARAAAADAPEAAPLPEDGPVIYTGSGGTVPKEESSHEVTFYA